MSITLFSRVFRKNYARSRTEAEVEQIEVDIRANTAKIQGLRQKNQALRQRADTIYRNLRAPGPQI